MTGATLESSVDVGPYTTLRPGTYLESDVHLGTHVEIKNSRLGRGTVVGHFSYIGDADIGSGTNIGAASPVTITGGDLPDTLGIKITNDAASLIRSIAETRGRNADRLEDMVRLGIANTAVEAVESGIVDFLAEDVEDLLQKLDGRLVKTSEGDYELNTNLGILPLNSWRNRYHSGIVFPRYVIWHCTWIYFPNSLISRSG